MAAFDFHLVGAGCGGTSLLAGLLDAHPELEVGFELFAYSHLMALDQTSADGQGIDLLQRVHSYLSACVQQAEHSAKPFWGNKLTTEQIARVSSRIGEDVFKDLDVFDVFFEECCEYKPVVFILRDGRTCIASKMRRGGHGFESAALRWRYSVRMMIYLTQQHPRAFCLKYEDLVRDPFSVLAAVCKFLSVPFVDQMQVGTSNSKMHQRYRREGFDASCLQLPDFSADCIALIENDLKACGYLVSL